MVDTALDLYTAEAFEQVVDLPENAERLLELINGEIVEKVPTEEHGMLAGNIMRLLGNYIIPNQLGKVGVEIRHRKPTDKYNVRMPDGSFRSGDSPVVTKGAVQQMPDLAVEVQSPTDKARDMREKGRYYLQNGANLVWLVYPKTRTIEICTLDEMGELEVNTVDEHGSLDGGKVLPGLTLLVKDIFAVLA